MWDALGRTDPDSQFVAALCWAVTASVSGAADDADRTIDRLRTAVAAGFRDAARLAKSADFDALRGRQDFKNVLAGLKAEKPPR
jgi:hypothetical protein